MHKFIKKNIHDYFKSNINQITYNLLFTNIIIYLFIFQGLFSKGEAGELVYHCTEPSHASDLMVGLNELRKSRTLCDVIICCGSREIPCHRNVLAAVSPYFRAMFTSILVLLFLKFLFQHISETSMYCILGDMIESVQRRVSIQSVEPEVMQQLVDYVYTSEICITQVCCSYLFHSC